MIIIAEAGINHKGNYTEAVRMADVAKAVGADAIKFQTFKKSEVNYDNLTYEETRELKEYCDEIDIPFLSTPHSISAIDYLEDLVPFYKVASPHLTNKEFLERIKLKQKPVLLSTGSIDHKDGMATLDEIEQAIEWLGDTPITLMHCVSKYPCYHAHLERIPILQEKFKFTVGLSDHTKSIIPHYDVPIIEKHFMLHEQTGCIDENVSLNPTEFELMVDLYHGKDIYSKFQ